MRILATDEQMKRMAANAINASRPAGMGYLHYKAESKFDSSAVEILNGTTKPYLKVDYHEGRMVKFYADKLEEGVWEVRDIDLDPEYQSWYLEYPTWQAIVESVGAKLEPLITFVNPEPAEGVITFTAGGIDMLVLRPNGDFIVKGNKVVNDIEVYHAFKEFLVESARLPR